MSQAEYLASRRGGTAVIKRDKALRREPPRREEKEPTVMGEQTTALPVAELGRAIRVVTVFPSCNPERAATARDRWRAKGYAVHVWVEESFLASFEADSLVRSATYPGYWCAVNHLAKAAVASGADIVVAIGDDMDPDPRPAQDIGAEYLARFPDGFGVMQPTGDPLDGTDRICGSPWLGRGWVEEAYGGAGPLWSGYKQFYGDEELLNVATKLGVLWQRKDLTQYHHHWVGGRVQPMHYQTRNSGLYWEHDQKMFFGRKKATWPGHERATKGRSDV